MKPTKIKAQVVYKPEPHIALRIYNDPGEHGKVKRFSIDRWAEFLAEGEKLLNDAVRYRHVVETEPELKGMSVHDLWEASGE